MLRAPRRLDVLLPRAASWSRRAATSGVVVAATACSLLVNQSDRQCTSTADCLALGPAFANTYCASSQACESSCTTNAQCTGSSTNDPWICRADHSCARLLSEDCAALLADPEDLAAPVVPAAGESSAGAASEVLWLGMLVPLDSATAPLSKAKEDAAQLARDDFNNAGELPPVVPNGPSRRFAFVVCDDTVDPVRAATHLVEDLKVPAIIGPVYSDTLITVATNVTDGAGVLLITPSATATDISDLPGKNDLIWRTCPSDAVQATAMAALIEGVLEPDIDKTVLTAGEPLKVANIHKGDSYGEGLADALQADLVFNGVSATVNQGNGNYIAFDYQDPSDPADTDPAKEYAAAVAQVLSFLPHVIALVGTQEVITSIMQPIEAGWPAATPYRPRYVLSDGAYPRPELVTLVGSNAELRARVLGTAPGTTSPAYTSFLQYYASFFQDGTQPVLSTAATYDAAYLLAYATAAIGPTTVTGASLVGGLKRIVAPGATAIDVGTDDITIALDALTNADGGSAEIKVSGTSGPLDYDTSTGDPDGDIQVWCLGIDATGAASGFVSSNVFYDASAKQLKGTLSCP